MANYAQLKAAIQNAVDWDNNNNEISGLDMLGILNTMITSLGAGYMFAGVAKLTPTQTDPGTPDQNVFYIAAEPGTYTNFPISGGYLQVAENEVAIFKYNGQWSKETTGAATVAAVSQLGQEITERAKSKPGKNLLDPGIAITGKYFDATGALVAGSSNYVISNFIPILPEETYHLSGDNDAAVGSYSVYSCLYDENFVFLGSFNVSTSKTFTTRAGTKYIRVCYNKTVEGVQLELGSVRTSYEPYNPVKEYINAEIVSSFDAGKQKALSSFGGEVLNELKLSAKAQGKNLFNTINSIIGYYISDNDGNILPHVNQAISQFIEIEPSTLYSFTRADGTAAGSSIAKILFYDKDFNILSGISASTASFTTPANTKYCRVTYSLSATEIQLEKGGTRTDYELYNPVADYINSILNPQKATGEIITSILGKNLFIKKNIIAAKYLSSDGSINEGSANYYINDYLPIEGGKTYHLSAKNDTVVGSLTVAYCFYDIDKNYISGASSGIQTFTTPETAKYIRITCHKTNTDIQLEPGSIRSVYNSYNKIGGYKTISKKYSSYTKTTDTLAANSVLSISEFPDAIKYGNMFSVYCKIPNGLGNGIRFGYGYNDVSANYVVLTSANIELWAGGSGTHTKISETAHGLTISEFISISATLDKDLNISILLITKLGSFSMTSSFGDPNGDMQICPLSQAITDVKLSVANSSLKEKIWAFGDSYFNNTSTSRVGYQLKQLGVIKLMMQGFGGQSPAEGYNTLIKALEYNTPKYLIWALGMNGTYVDNWKPTYDKLIDVCANLGIELILCTIPVPKSSLAYYGGKQDLTDFVRQSGYRFIDTYAAVGSDSLGNWYNQESSPKYQSDDDVHTTVIGAQAIANQWFIDFPEICEAINP